MYVGGISVAFGLADEDGDWSIDLASQYGNFAAGSHSIQIGSTLGQNSQLSAVQTLVVDLTAPTAAPTIDSISDDTGISDSDGITSDRTLTLTGTAEANATIHIFDFGTVVATTTADSNGAWTCNTGNLGGDQLYIWSVSQLDLAGNEGPRSEEHSIFIDSTAPAAPSIDGSQDGGAFLFDNVSNYDRPFLYGTAEAGAVVTIMNGGDVVGTATYYQGTYWSFASPAVADGTYTFTAIQTEAAGNVSSVSNGLTVTVDTVAPTEPTINATISDDTGVSGTDRLTNDRTVSLTGTCAADTFVLRLYDGPSHIATIITYGSTTWGFTTSELSDGVHNFRIVAGDLAGNESGSQILAVTVDGTAPDAPVIGASFEDRPVSSATPRWCRS